MRILETALYAENLDETAAFYRHVLGLERIAEVPGRHVFFRVGGQVLLLFKPSATRQPPPLEARLPVPPHGAEGPGHVCFAASAAEIEGWARHLASHGVTIESAFDWPQGGRSVYFRDPAGNALEFAEPRIWGLEQTPVPRHDCRRRASFSPPTPAHRRVRRTATNPATGVMRHADASDDEAIACARECGLCLPGILG